MIVFVHPLHGKERPIGSVFISYSRLDENPVENLIVRSLRQADIPYFIDTKDIGIEKTASVIKRLIDDSSCGILVLSKNSMKSYWMWYEMGLLEGLGKRIFPYSLMYGEEQAEFIKSLPAFVSEYNIPNKIEDLIQTVRQETFIAGKLSRHDSLRPDIFSDLKEASVDLIFDKVPETLFGQMKFGVLLVRFGSESNDKKVYVDDVQARDQVLVNIPLSPSARSNDFKGGKLKVTYTIPVHRVLGTTFKFFIDVKSLDAVEAVTDMLKAQGAEGVSASMSAERQRVYFLVPEKDIPVSQSSPHIQNNYMYPV